jgi:Xaa-Pro aminopeptidase
MRLTSSERSGFTRAEYLERVHRIRAAMEGAGIEVLILPDPANMYYVTGYDLPSHYQPQAAVLALELEEPLLFLRAMDVASGRSRIFPGPDHVIGFPEHYIGSADRHPMEFIAAQIRNRRWHSRRVAVTRNTLFYTVQSHERLQAGLGGAALQDPGLLMDRVRAVKSDQEVFYMRRAGVIVQQEMDAVLHAIRPGVRECDAVAIACDAAIRGTPEFCGGIPVEPSIARGEKAAAVHTVFAEDVFHQNEAVTIELAACHRNYHCAVARTLHLGAQPPEMQRLADVVQEGFRAALDAMRPDRTCAEAALAWHAVIARAGYERECRVGHSIGMGFPPDWGENSASLQPGDSTILTPGMTFYLVCAMGAGRHHAVVGETVLITGSGNEVLTSVSTRLFVREP